MKKITLLLLAALMVTVSSCEKNRVKYISATVNLNTSAVPADVSVPQSFKVKFTNFETKYELEVESVQGVAHTDSLIAGVYSISVSQASSQNGFSYLFSGTLTNTSIAETGLSFTLPIEVVKSSALVIKEVYYTGSEGYYFRDQFYEIYNNSEEIVYADGLCLSAVLSETIYTWDIANEDDYIFCQLIWKIPGTGNQYPIKPGESIIIAQYAANHNDADKNNGKSIDLSTAEFETYVEKYAAKQSDCNAINLVPICNSLGYWAYQYLNTVSGFALAIFYPTNTIADENYIFSLTPSTKTKAREVLRKDVVDAVEFMANETNMEKKVLPTSLDAGGKWCSGTYKKESVMRKVASTKEDGRKIYQDTNNSTNDFEVSTTPTIRRNGANRPTWSTWTTAK